MQRPASQLAVDTASFATSTATTATATATATASGTGSSAEDILALRPAPSPVVLYWSETMDIALAKQVRACLFDFAAIAQALTDLALAGALGHSGDRAVQALKGEVKEGTEAGVGAGAGSLLTSEACRVRWAELDAEQWSVGQHGASQGSAQQGLGHGQGHGHGQAGGLVPEVSYKVYVQTSDLTNGVQPDFQTLASKACGAMPKYLSPPTMFPSMADMDDDEEEDDEDEEEEGMGVEEKVMR